MAPKIIHSFRDENHESIDFRRYQKRASLSDVRKDDQENYGGAANSMGKNIRGIDRAENIKLGNGIKSAATKRRPFQRVPLGGKDSNRSVPTLSRSSSSSSNLSKDHQKLHRPLALKKPSLSKANSTLGFTPKHDMNAFGEQELVSYEDKRSRTPINNKSEQRLKLAPLLVNMDHSASTHSQVASNNLTDSLVKKNSNDILAEVPKLSSTLSENTKKLHSSNLPRIQDDLIPEPVKKPKSLVSDTGFEVSDASTKVSGKPFEIREDSSEFDDLEIEYIPEFSKPKPYNPIDVEPMNNRDISMLTDPSKIDLENVSLSESEINVDNYDVDISSFEQERQVKDGKEDSSVATGLSLSELNDLLEF